MTTPRLTEQQYAEVVAGRQASRISPESRCAKPKAQKGVAGQGRLIRQSTRQPNKTEAAFAAEVLYWRRLRGEIWRYEFEAVTLKLGNGVRYTPDYWIVRESDGVIYFDFLEVKGEKRKGKVVARDDATVKLKLAKRLFPEFAFWLVWKDESGEWQSQEVLK